MITEPLEFPGKLAFGYIEGILSHSDKLGVFALAAAPREGRVFAFAPKPQEEIQADQIRCGSVLDWNGCRDEFRAAETAFIEKFLNSSKNAIAVFEGWGLGLDEEPKLPAKVKFFINETSLWGIYRPPKLQERLPMRENYVYARSTDDDLQDSLLKYRRTHPTVGVLSVVPPNEELVSGSVKNDDFIKKLAVGAQYIFVGAFDEETNLIWELPRGHH